MKLEDVREGDILVYKTGLTVKAVKENGRFVGYYKHTNDTGEIFRRLESKIGDFEKQTK